MATLHLISGLALFRKDDERYEIASVGIRSTRDAYSLVGS